MATASNSDSCSRFNPPTGNEEMSRICSGFVPQNTLKNTSWAMNVYMEWREQRNSSDPSNQCLDNLLECPTIEGLNFWLSHFVCEIKNKKGEPYPPRTIHQILASLQRHMLSHVPDAPKFLDKKNSRFRELHNACDNVYRGLHNQGVGTDIAHSVPDEMWSVGVFADSEPKALQRAIFYYVGKHFCVRGGSEQRSLGPSQFVRSSSPDCYTYVEHGSKNRSGGLNQMHLENKRVHCVAIPEKRPVCLVHLLDVYLHRLPSFAFEKDIFYCRPKTFRPSKDVAWYENVAVGKNKLSSMVADICADAGLPRRTNHSLCATGATYNNVPE